MKEIYQDVTKCLHIVPSRLFCNKNINRSGIYDFCFIWPDAANLIAIPWKFFKKLKCRSGRNGVSGCIMAPREVRPRLQEAGNSSVCVECNSPLIDSRTSLSNSQLLEPWPGVLNLRDSSNRSSVQYMSSSEPIIYCLLSECHNVLIVALIGFT